MFCPDCGELIDYADNFCSTCGHKLIPAAEDPVIYEYCLTGLEYIRWTGLLFGGQAKWVAWDLHTDRIVLESAPFYYAPRRFWLLWMYQKEAEMIYDSLVMKLQEDDWEDVGRTGFGYGDREFRRRKKTDQNRK